MNTNKNTDFILLCDDVEEVTAADLWPAFEVGADLVTALDTASARGLRALLAVDAPEGR